MAEDDFVILGRINSLDGWSARRVEGGKYLAVLKRGTAENSIFRDDAADLERAVRGADKRARVPRPAPPMRQSDGRMST